MRKAIKTFHVQKLACKTAFNNFKPILRLKIALVK